MSDSKALAPARPLGAFNDAELLQFVKDQPDKAAAQLGALMRFNTALIPDTVFVRRGQDLTLRQVRVHVRLAESRKEMISFKSKKKWKDENGQWQEQTLTNHDITAVGYLTLNRVAGLYVITPEQVVVNAQRQPNPYVETDENSGRPKVVYCRKVVIGPSRDLGNLVATDVMLRFDLDLYLIENLLAKLEWADKDDDKERSEAQKRAKTDDELDQMLDDIDAHAMGVWGQPEDKPKRGRWKFYPIATDVGVWFNLMHPKFQAAIRDHVTRMKYCERIAQTVAMRNAMKQHPAMPASAADSDVPGTALYAMVGWSNNMTAEGLARLKEMVENNTLHEEYEVKRVEVTKVDATDDAEAETVAAGEASTEAQVEEAGEAQPEATAGQEEQKPAEPMDRAALIAAATKAYQGVVDGSGKREARARLEKHGITTIEEATDDQLRKFADETPF